jgi:competence ComEA-like helix-hairpin-helix protein
METKTLVNLNTAEEDELAQVPGIGPALAKRLVAARPFNSLDDVRRVPGIGASTLDRIAPYAPRGSGVAGSRSRTGRTELRRCHALRG